VQLVFRRPNVRLTGTAYLSDVDGLILAARPASPFESLRLTNAGQATLRGIEIAGRASVGVNSIFGSLSLARPLLDGQPTPEVATALGHAGAIFSVGRRYTITPSLLLRAGRRRAVGDTRAGLPGYVLLNLDAHATRVYRTLDLGLRMDNLLDTEVLDPAPIGTLTGDYPRAGRSLELEARYRF
jgi:outer membrane receptor protein involved in Fe transport